MRTVGCEIRAVPENPEYILEFKTKTKPGKYGK